MAFLDVFFPKKMIPPPVNQNVFDRFPGIDIHLDGTDGESCHVNLTEVVKERGTYRFERRRLVVKRDKLEKIVEQIINISTMRQ